jgi:transcriptional antiterminator/mannitol/fructose-specific phosphotransferase system IIA component (Ntr-type)
MDSELYGLLGLLVMKKQLTLDEAGRSLQLSKRQVTYRLSKINELLEQAKKPLVEIQSGRFLSIAPDSQAYLESLAAKAGQAYVFSPQERQLFLLILLFCNFDYLPMSLIMEALQVSRSTAVADLRALEAALEKDAIRLEYSRGRGYFLAADELDIRRVFIQSLVTTDAGPVLAAAADVVGLDDVNLARERAVRLAKKYGIRLIEDRVEEFIYVFLFLKVRLRRETGPLRFPIPVLEMDMMSGLKEYNFVDALLAEYENMDILSREDVFYLTAWVLGVSFGDVEEDTNDCLMIADLTGRIMQRFELLSGVRYPDTETIFKQLFAHLRPAYYRMMFRLPVHNPLTGRVQEEFGPLHSLVKETLKVLEPLFPAGIAEEETAYLTMHFAAVYQGCQEQSRPIRRRALVICPNGMGSSIILYNELRQMFPELDFLPPQASSRAAAKNVDIIFSTHYSVRDADQHVPVIKVKPVMTMSERYRVMKDVYFHFKDDFSAGISEDALMQIVAKHAKITDPEGLYQALTEYICQSQVQPALYSDLSLADMLAKHRIRTGVFAKDWQEAVRKGYEPLLEEGFITEGYVQDTIDAANILGPYMVIAPGICLAHTKASAGARQYGMALTVLEKPVAFGAGSNDPVRYVFALSALEEGRHIQAMSEFLDLLKRPEFFQDLDAGNISGAWLHIMKKA